MTRRDYSTGPIPPDTRKRWRRDNTAHETALGYLMRHIEVDAAGCWIWTGPVNHHGYGIPSHWQYPRIGAHRLAWRVTRGEIPAGLTLDHLCRVRRCVNPDHLEPVTMRENLARSPLTHMNQTHCKRGHEFTPENTLRRKGGHRACRECYRTVYDVRRGRRAA